MLVWQAHCIRAYEIPADMARAKISFNDKSPNTSESSYCERSLNIAVFDGFEQRRISHDIEALDVGAFLNQRHTPMRYAPMRYMPVGCKP